MRDFRIFGSKTSIVTIGIKKKSVRTSQLYSTHT